jgi:aspartate racemase
MKLKNKNKNLKKIAIIGGVGPQASHYLYGKVMKLAQIKYKARDNQNFPEIVLYSTPVPDFISNKKSIVKAKQMFERVLADFNSINVSHIAIASNTVHLLLDFFKSKTKAEFITITNAVVEKILKDKRTKVGVLASPMTINLGLYKKPLRQKEIKVIYPDKKDINKVEEMIRAVIAGENNGNLKKDYIKVVQRLFNKGVQAIILGCTELPLAINYEVIDNKIYSSMDLLAEKIVDVYYAFTS